MDVEFRDICGNSHVLRISDDTKVADACNLLSLKTQINKNQIFLVSPSENMNFSQDTESIVDILKENQDFIIFMKHLPHDIKNGIKFQQESATNNLVNFDQKQEFNISQANFEQNRQLSNSFINTVQNLNDWQYNDIYDEYSNTINEIPHDLQDRIDQIAEFGYSVDDIKEALRITNYDVLVATHLLVLVNSQENIEDIMNDLDNEYSSIDNSETEIESNINLTEFDHNKEKTNIINNENVKDKNTHILDGKNDSVNNISDKQSNIID